MPEGIEEILPGEGEHLERLRRDFIDLFACWGYRLVVPPLIEFLESLLVGTGCDLDLQTFKLIDQASGRLMGIRADMTPQVARIDARASRSEVPARLCYIGTVLHTQVDHLDRSRSPMQVGAELYGHGGNESDIEVIRLMLEMFAIAGITDVHLDLGHVGIYRGLARQAGLDTEKEAELFTILQGKARFELESFLSDAHIPAPVSEMLRLLLDLTGSIAIIEKAKECLAGADESVRQAIWDLEAIAVKLAAQFPQLPINFDLAELRGYHYQTGVVFAAFVPGVGREIARGGRYDDIGRVFGRARPATGFSSDLRVLQRLSPLDSSIRSEQYRIFAPCNSDPDLHETIRVLRSKGRTVIQELPGQSGTAKEMGCAMGLRREGSKWIVGPIHH